MGLPFFGKRQVDHAGRSCSSSTLVAKVASDRDKPYGLTVVRPADQAGFIAELPIEDFHGIGPVTAEKMQDLGIETGADLQETPERELTYHFGKRGRHFKKLAMGEDDRPVKPDRERKSVGAERTFSEDISEPGAISTASTQSQRGSQSGSRMPINGAVRSP